MYTIYFDMDGTIANLYGVENVGFHMDGLLMTVDFDRPLTKVAMYTPFKFFGHSTYATLSMFT